MIDGYQRVHSHTNDRLDGQIPKNLTKKQPNKQTATNTPTTQHYNKPTTYCVLALNLEYINGNRTATDVQVNLYGGYDCTDI